MAKAMRHARGGRRRRVRPTVVVDLSSVREQRRRELAERRVRSVMDGNRAALSRLFASGLIFTQKGSRAGRTPPDARPPSWISSRASARAAT